MKDPLHPVDLYEKERVSRRNWRNLRDTPDSDTDHEEQLKSQRGLNLTHRLLESLTGTLLVDLFRTSLSLENFTLTKGSSRFRVQWGKRSPVSPASFFRILLYLCLSRYPFYSDSWGLSRLGFDLGTKDTKRFLPFNLRIWTWLNPCTLMYPTLEDLYVGSGTLPSSQYHDGKGLVNYNIFLSNVKRVDTKNEGGGG